MALTRWQAFTQINDDLVQWHIHVSRLQCASLNRLNLSGSGNYIFHTNWVKTMHSDHQETSCWHIEAETRWPPFSWRHFECIFLNENVWISLTISLKFVTRGQINNIPALVYIMACCRAGDKPYLNQGWEVYRRIYASLGLNESNRLNLSGSGNYIFHTNWVKTMHSDHLVLCITRSSAVKILTE